MATGLGSVNGCPDSDINDSRKRPLESEVDIGATKRSHHGGANGTYHFKILVPSVAAGAIIGKGGETIAQLQKEAGARVKMSKASDYYPGTTERVCLITGNVDGILRIHEFIMEKIKEKPDPNAKMAIDFDHKQPAEREKQVKILVPNSTAGMIIGKAGSYIKQIKEESGAYVQISQKSKDHALAERCITVIGEIDSNKNACNLILAKIVEDPQSGSCLNVSYADVTGPVANFNPTGSPYANPGSVQGSGSVMNNSNASYSSNGSLNSLSPTLNNNFNHHHHHQQQHHSQGGAGASVFPFAGMSMGIAGGGHAAGSVNPATAQMIENVRHMLRGGGYSEQTIAEIAAALTTLANYGMLGLMGLGLGGMINSMNGAQMIGGLGIGMATGSSTPNNCQVVPQQQTPALSGQGVFTSTGPTIQGMDGSCTTVATAGPLGAGSSMFGPIGSIGGNIAGLNLGPGFNSPTSRSSERFPGDPSMFDPFRHTSPTLGSPSLPINNNSFGLGTTGLSASPSPMRGKSPTPNEQRQQAGADSAKLEIEVGENIVGAILGPGGKSLVEIQRFSGANIQISKKGIFAPGTRNRIVTISGMPNAVSTAQYLIEQQIAEEEGKRARQNSMGVMR